MFAKLLLAAITLQALLVKADPTPIVPGPGDSYKQGGDCPIEWSADTTGQWTNMQIELKTGNNIAMVPLMTVTTIDATKETKYVFPCPEVSPNSPIYFYEFTSSSSSEKFWTTRFTITDKNGKSTPPTETTQPNGDKIPWGTGTITGNSSSVAGSPPSSGTDSLSSSSPPALLESTSSSLPPSSRMSSTSSPAPAKTGGTTGSSQSNTNGDKVVAVPKALVFVIGLVITSTAFFF